MFPLLSLPDDLILPIVAAVHHPADLISLAQTCSKLRDLAEAQLFRSLFINRGSLAERLGKVLQVRPERFGYVQKVEATPGTGDWQGVEIMPSLVKRMHNLRNLHIESPIINNFRFDDWWEEQSVSEYMEAFAKEDEMEKPLKNIESFIFHSHGKGNRYYGFSIIRPVFTSRYLKHIHISCVHVGEFDVDEKDVGKSAIQSIVLDECNISHVGLETLLSLPRNLYSLSMQENRQHMRYHRFGALNRHPSVLLSALNQQRHSLRYLQHSCPSDTVPEQIPLDVLNGPGLASFKNLETIELGEDSCLRHCLVVPSLAPPNLSTLRLTNLSFRADDRWDLVFPIINRVSFATPFAHLELHTDPEYSGGRHAINFLKGESRTRKIIDLARVMKERGTTTKVIALSYHSCIPPYLWADHGGAPKQRLVLDSERFWAEEQKYVETAQEIQKTMERGEGSNVQINTLDGGSLINSDLAIFEEVEVDGTVVAAKMSAGYKFAMYSTASARVAAANQIWPEDDEDSDQEDSEEDS
ncbi:hypothetical protein EJ04DRAFT_511394 [Polyplosphaeria fusca]|uniref:F-box domain-containing protein n=1 Tax=Polyplosphaeria fusca TaxID=682080 RepID=A0A9P4V536_9PLEO|nr:hypothetical protein EJ04DRAFT_511394 [Polyplosphaeria fusca]